MVKYNEKLIGATLEELKEEYRKLLRSEICEKENAGDNYANGEGLFFNRFRKKEESHSEILYKEDILEKYIDFRRLEEKRVLEEIEEIENRIAYERFFLNWERKAMRKSGKNSRYMTNSATRYRVDKISSLKRKKEKILESSSIAAECVRRKQVLEDVENQSFGKLVNVDYVEFSKDKIKKALRNGDPVNIFGHLGSGKTAIAVEAAVEFAVETRVQNYLEREMEKWYLENKDAGFDNVLEKFAQLNGKIREHYKNVVNNPKDKEWEKLQPLFISGSHNLTYEDMFVEKTLKLESSFSEDSFGRYLNIITENFYEWIDEHKNELKEMSPEEAINIKIEIWKSLSDILVARNSSFGTEIKKVEKEILKALRQGRVVIIDELNAIAMQNLIGLNDILQKKIGTYAYVTGVGPVKIEEGFGLIGTGNLSSSTVNYEGTNELNPAFKSRFVNMEYNYLPQNLVGRYNNQENMYKNQLFRVILTRLLDKDGSLRLPYPERSLDELFRFAQLSKLTQNVFTGKWREDKDSDDRISDVELRESVLSIRNIMRVLDEWNLGEEKDFSKALWDGFISSITSPEDQNYILSQAVRFGFFRKDEGWNTEIKYFGDATVTLDEIREKEYTYIRPKIEVLSWLDVVEIIYGKYEGEDRKLKKLFGISISENEKSINPEKYIELDREIRHMENSAEIMEYILNKSDGEE